MLTDDPGQEDRVARLRQPQATSNNAQNSLAKFAKTDFGHLRASLKLRDAAIGVVVVGVVFCLGNLDFNRYQFQPFLNWMIWLLLLSLPSVCMIFLPLWLSRKRRANLVHWPGIRSILVEAAIAAPLTLLIILFDHLLGIDDSEIRRAWEWVILRPDLRMIFVTIVPFIVVIGPVAEELFYRAFLYNALRSKLPAVIAATAQAALFAISHFYGLALTALLFGHGLCLIGIYLWRKTLLTPIFVHVFRNLIFLVWLLVAAVSYTNTAQLGVLLDPHEEGCLIVEIMSGSAADKAGLRDGDIVTSVDDRPVESPEELTSLIQGYGVGDRVAIAIIRDGKRLELEAILGRRSSPNLRESSFGPRDWRLENEKWACYWVHDGREIRCVFFLKEEQCTLAGPLGRRSTIGIVAYSTYLQLSPKHTLQLIFPRGNPKVLTVAEDTYDLSNGRVFLCEIVNDQIVVQQLDIQVRQTTNPDAEIRRIVKDEEDIRQFFSLQKGSELWKILFNNKR